MWNACVNHFANCSLSRGGRCQASELAALLPEYAFVRDTAMEYEDGSTEGLALYFSARLRVASRSVSSLGASAEDTNRRICQRVLLESVRCPEAKLDLLHTHLSFQRTTQVQNLKKILKLLTDQRFNSTLQLLVGDLNTHPDYMKVRDVLTGKDRLPGKKSKWDREARPFIDVWQTTHPHGDPGVNQGMTYSTTKPATRCDYILARGDFKAVDASTVGGPRKVLQRKQLVAPSDHYAVVATLHLEEVHDQCNNSSGIVGSERAKDARANNEL
mmetsp:Transcript_16003/g.30821  ORF Transcript_16003/g.30821 Transcript_16003/m.30821 type:complete len:272 (-) Transcript_16003:110-925(-)